LNSQADFQQSKDKLDEKALAADEIILLEIL
jgi:hypothetical protein